jgi:hypothetical protein
LRNEETLGPCECPRSNQDATGVECRSRAGSLSGGKSVTEEPNGLVQQMLFISEYKLKPHLTKAEVKRLMDIFGKRGSVEGEVANYVRADGTGGFTIAENDDLTSAYADVLLYSEYMTFTVTPVLSIDDAVGPISAYIGD